MSLQICLLQFLCVSSLTDQLFLNLQVFVACTRSIPTTVILPQLDLDGDGIETLQELTKQCRVDAQSAQASVPEDAVAIKQRIMEAGKNGSQGKRGDGPSPSLFVLVKKHFLVVCVERKYKKSGFEGMCKRNGTLWKLTGNSCFGA